MKKLRNIQYSLFNKAESPSTTPAENDDYPYIIYVSTSKGNCRGILYEGKTEDGCRQFISTEKTSGIYLGVEWAYFYTAKSRLPDFSIKTYKAYNKLSDGKSMKDDGRFGNEILGKYGLRLFGLK